MGASEEPLILEHAVGKSGALKEQKKALEQVRGNIEAYEFDTVNLHMQADQDATRIQLSTEAAATPAVNAKRVRWQNVVKKVSDIEEEKREVRRATVQPQPKLVLLSATKKANSSTEKKVQEKVQEKEDKERGTCNGNGLTRSHSRSNSLVGPMSPRSASKEAQEIGDLREKVKFLEAALKAKSLDVEAWKRSSHEKETNLLYQIECLELANEQLLQGGVDNGLEQLQLELTRLQKQNAMLAQRERELQFQLSTMDMLQKEVQHLQEVNEQLVDTASRNGEGNGEEGGGKLLEKVTYLEAELSEALEVNNMYKLQLHTAFAEQENVQAAALRNFGDVDQVICELLTLRKQTKAQEDELQDIRDRFFLMSIHLAETEASREELLMKVKRLQNLVRR